ncbi:nucleotide exchange factor GrpE [Flavobacteriaceae bacterium]|jgi:molecular chaperone GrpE|nr:nucleotide exchange factor GrpE [Flavobacteriaceae bacterium]MDC1320732.1 nucleotide exchange factor GrpE [Flavobacteriaceae bacterium]|tara:strand:- start:1352 stop:1873 length:522 start_codon:yes stop_codon:yes gene_type:complete
MSKKNTKVKKESKKPKSKEKDLDVDVVTNDVDDVQKEKEKFLRLFAEFENYKKRTTKERIELFSTASQELMTSLLPVLDDFDRANQEIIKNSDDEIYKGVSLIQNKLFDTLKSKGLKIVEVNKGDLFDADDHEAVTQIPAPSDDLKGKIIDVIEKGYKLGEKVIRYPKVIIGK